MSISRYFHTLSYLKPIQIRYQIRYRILSKLGLSNKEISRLLNISPDSVKTSKKRLKRKLNIKPGSEFSF